MGLKIKKGDQVIILSGDEKEKTGKVISILPKKYAVIVEGRNMVTKHQRPQRSTRATPQTQTGRITKPAPLPISKVMLVCPRCSKPTKVGRRLDNENQVVRVCKKCNELIDAD
jgi:large subunit ribosomal protein L24